ncbi:hypothetical protein [Butyrivibrio sp. XB500-5]|uniref:hypothetical protein n=1 Tax=Butyrivibrio sp. XB500-5 TaxID=2364880 RepID=UPI003FA42256
MGKILKSWSGMRKYLENEMLADSLRGRVRYNCTAYVGMDVCHSRQKSRKKNSRKNG